MPLKSINQALELFIMVNPRKYEIKKLKINSIKNIPTPQKLLNKKVE